MNKAKGSLTIFLALVMMSFLTFCLVLIEGTRIYFARVQAMQAMELAEFSVLSDYQKELFEQYGVFFVDLDYEQGSEQTGILEERAKNYLIKNAEELLTKDLRAENFCRATDGGGSAFFCQAVEFMKVKSGYKLFEELADIDGTDSDYVDIESVIKENKSIVSDFSLPDISFPSVRVLTEAVFGENAEISEKSVDLQECIMQRTLCQGVGSRKNASMSEMQLFHGYLFRQFNHYGAEQSGVWKEALEYQLEYVISGRESDRENLENIMWRIFLLRAGGDYLFYHQDAVHWGEAQAEAMMWVGFTGNAAIIEAVTEIFLISQAIEDGIEETKQIFAGEKVPLYQKGIFAGIALGYEEYLYLFLNTISQTEKIYRCMDIAELEVRKKSGYESFQLDHCVDSLVLQWDYQFESLFADIPLLNGGIYENTITRKIYYEN